MQEYRRKNFITARKYQIKYTAVILGVVLLTLMVLGATMYWDFSHYFSVRYFGDAIQWEKYAIRIAFLLIIVIFMGIFFSHKIIGPISRIEEALERLSKGDFYAKLKLRPGDDFYHLSEDINTLSEHLKDYSEKNPDFLKELKKEK